MLATLKRVQRNLIILLEVHAFDDVDFTGVGPFASALCPKSGPDGAL